MCLQACREREHKEKQTISVLCLFVVAFDTWPSISAVRTSLKVSIIVIFTSPIPLRLSIIVILTRVDLVGLELWEISQEAILACTKDCTVIPRASCGSLKKLTCTWQWSLTSPMHRDTKKGPCINTVFDDMDATRYFSSWSRTTLQTGSQ